jgi:hypothetical protein
VSAEKTPRQVVEEIYNGWQDHARWCRECLSIRDKRGASVPLELWPAQKKLHDAIERQRKAGKPVRICFLKARRVSVSVAAAAEIFHEVPFQAGQHGMIVAHDLDSTKEIFDYCQQFQESYRPFGGMIRLPAAVKSNERKLEWENGSWIKVQTANNLKAGRASSLRYLQLDEYAFWRDARTLMTGLLNTVPDDKDTAVFVISTANGVGGPFHELWQQAQQGDTEWVAVFFAWWEHPEYVRDVEGPEDVFERSLGTMKTRYGDELAERAKYNLTLKQLAWRRWAIDNKCQKSVALFRQEYPGSPEEAFLTSGRPRLNHEALGRMAIVREPLRGFLEWVRVGLREQVVFTPDEQGPLCVYRRPEPRRLYCIGADTATGKDSNDGKGGVEDPDWSVATVIDALTGEQVAKYRERVEEPVFGELLAALGHWYNRAFVTPESNSYGRAVIARLLDLEYPPSLIYQQDREAHDRESTSLNKLGYYTSEVTRPQLVSALDAAIREYAVLIRDANTLSECLTFVVKSNGRAEAQNGCHDDEVFALALAVMGLRQMPRTMPKETARAPARALPQRYGRGRLSQRGRG